MTPAVGVTARSKDLRATAVTTELFLPANNVVLKREKYGVELDAARVAESALITRARCHRRALSRFSVNTLWAPGGGDDVGTGSFWRNAVPEADGAPPDAAE